MWKGNISSDAQYVVVVCKMNCFVVELCVNVNLYEREIGFSRLSTKHVYLFANIEGFAGFE